MKLVLASRNRHKIGEIGEILREVLPNVTVLSLDDVGITEDIEENGTTIEENALIKARAAVASGYIAFGDDSGLFVNALDGAPGVYSARYAGGHGNDAENNKKLIKELDGKTDRSAYFACAIACAMPDGREFTVVGRAEGEILSTASGEGGFGYDPYFYFPPLGKTFADLDEAEKNAVSHRGAAVRAFGKRLTEILKTEETI